MSQWNLWPKFLRRPTSAVDHCACPLKKAPFLILDDSTSALDYLTEARLLKSIKEELSDTSLILVSQRTNSLKSADQILVLNKGHQVGLGNHDFLLSTNEIYQEIHYSQHGREEA